MAFGDELLARLRKIEALMAGAGTAGERQAANAALDRVKARLAEQARHDPPIELQFSMADAWSRQLFVALCRRNGLKPYRYYRQKRTTVMLRVPRGFCATEPLTNGRSHAAVTSFCSVVQWRRRCTTLITSPRGPSGNAHTPTRKGGNRQPRHPSAAQVSRPAPRAARQTTDDR